jgi:hypothetical protein
MHFDKSWGIKATVPRRIPNEFGHHQTESPAAVCWKRDVGGIEAQPEAAFRERCAREALADTPDINGDVLRSRNPGRHQGPMCLGMLKQSSGRTFKLDLCLAAPTAGGRQVKRGDRFGVFVDDPMIELLNEVKCRWQCCTFRCHAILRHAGPPEHSRPSPPVNGDVTDFGRWYPLNLGVAQT